jgi:hypothetical protein
MRRALFGMEVMAGPARGFEPAIGLVRLVEPTGFGGSHDLPGCLEIVRRQFPRILLSRPLPVRCFPRPGPGKFPR